MTTLPVWATVKAAYGAIWAQRWRLLRFAALPFALLLAIDVGGTRLSEAATEPLADTGSEGWIPLSAVIDELIMFLCAVVLIAFVVPCCRLFLLGPAAIDAGGRWPVRRVYLGMLAVTVLVTLVFEVPLTLLDHQYLSEETWIWLAAEVGFAAVYLGVTLKLVFLYPVICLARHWDLARRWGETNGNFWRLAAAFLVTLLPLIAAVFLWAVPFALWQETLWGEISNVQLFESLAFAVFMLLGEAFWVAVTVIAFALLTGHPAKGLWLPPVGEAAP